MPENMLLLLTDQERFDVTRPSGPPVETPAIDRLQREGVAFERAYTPIAICSSARASLLTGLYPHTHGMLNNCHEADAVLPDLPPDLPTFGELLADAGYENSYLGKWHVGRDQGPGDFGFERLDGAGHGPEDEQFRAFQREQGVDPDAIELEDTIERPRGHPPVIAGRTPIPEEATYTYYLAERTIERLEALAEDSGESGAGDGTDTGTPGPFFHRTDFPGPHPPYVVPEPYASMYDPDGENWGTEPLTWAEFSEVVADVKDQNDDLDYGYVFQADAYAGLSCCNFNEFMTTWGGAYFGGTDNLFGPIGDRPITVDDDQVADSIRMVRTFIYGDDDEESLDDYTGPIAPEAVTNWTEQETSGAFGNGNAAFMRNWPFFVGLFGGEDEFGEDLGVMPLPYAVAEDEAEYPGVGGTAGALGGWHVAVNPNTQHMDAALEAVRAAASDEFNFAIFEILGQIPPKPALLEQQRAQEIETVGRYVDTFQVVGENAIPRPVTVIWPDQSRQVYQEINATYSQQKGPEEALSDLAAALEEIEQSA